LFKVFSFKFLFFVGCNKSTTTIISKTTTTTTTITLGVILVIAGATLYYKYARTK
jgi:hypothetical protein